MKNITNILKAGTLAAVLVLSGCKKDKTETPVEEQPAGGGGSGSRSYMLVIDNGAQALDVGESFVLSAHLVSTSGNVVAANNVTWSSSVGSISGGIFSAGIEAKVGTISASCTHEGHTYTAAVPVNIQKVKSSRVFGVVPSAVIWSTNSGTIKLNPVYLGMEASSFTYSSDNTSVVTVDGNGVITFHAAGNANIKVTGTIGGNTTEFIVPVMVVGAPDVPLPVTRISVDPVLAEMFRGESVTLNAKAWNSAGAQVSNVAFTYSVEVKKEDDDDNTAIPVTVDANGKITAKSIGAAYVKVYGSGLMAQAEVLVNPDTVIMVTPFNVTLGTDFMNPSNSKTTETLTAKTYKIDRDKYRAKDYNAFVLIANSTSLQWDLPLTGVPQIDDMFKVVTLKSKTSTSCVVEQIPGKVGSTFVIAHAGSVAGGASIMVNP